MNQHYAPEEIMRAALRVLYVAGYTTRNWTLSEDVSRRQINDLWEAIHEIPNLLARWDSTDDHEAELGRYLREYDNKRSTPRLQEIYDKELGTFEA